MPTHAGGGVIATVRALGEQLCCAALLAVMPGEALDLGLRRAETGAIQQVARVVVAERASGRGRAATRMPATTRSQQGDERDGCKCDRAWMPPGSPARLRDSNNGPV